VTTRPDLRDEGGTILTWMLCLVVMTLFLGGIALDLWRAFSERRAVAGIVDAAAVAGASGIDADLYRATNQVALDPALAFDLAAANLAGQGETVDDPQIVVAADNLSISVSGSRDVPFTLLRVLLPDLADAHVQATAVSAPMLDGP
jgi:hypothetical protein